MFIHFFLKSFAHKSKSMGVSMDVNASMGEHGREHG